MKEGKYKLEIRCRLCGNRSDISDEELGTYRNEPRALLSLPICCGKMMHLHSYRPTRDQFCNDARCVFAQGNYCGCTCEGKFHQSESGYTKPIKYIFA